MSEKGESILEPEQKASLFFLEVNTAAPDVTHTSAVKESFELACVCVCVTRFNAAGGWARWPSSCVGGSKSWQTDPMGTAFKEDAQINKLILRTHY